MGDKLWPTFTNTEEAFVLICEKCGKKLESKDENPSQAFKDGLKSKAKEKLGPKRIRPILTSCLDICPDDKIAYGIIPLKGGIPKFYTVSKGEVKETIELIVEQSR